jgi:hypothetical protein
MNIDSMNTFFAMLKDASYQYLIYIIAIFALIFLFRGMRINSLLNIGSQKKLFSICTIHNFLNRLFPFGIGDLSLPVLLKKIGDTDYTTGINAFILLRLIDVFMVLVIFTASYVYVKPYFYENYIIALLVCALIMTALAIVKFNYLLKIILLTVKYCPAFLILNKKEQVSQKVDSLHCEYSKSRNYKMLIGIVLYSFANWIATYLIYLAYLRMFDLKYGFFGVILCSTLAVITSNIPFINGIGRFGSFELGWLAGFVLVGNMSKDIAIPLGAFVNTLNFVICLGFALAGYTYLSFVTKKHT